MKKLRSVFPVLFSILLLTGCWSDAPMDTENSSHDTGLLESGEELHEQTSSDTLLPERFALPYTPEHTLDGISCPDGMQQVVASLLYEGLFRLDASFQPEPWLCRSYHYDSESMTYTFALRTDVVFSDGTPLTAADVVNSLERAKQSARYASRLSGVTAITAESDSTVSIALSAPNTGFSTLLDIPICKKDSPDSSAPVGTGPYLFSSEDSGTWLIANQTWWRSLEPPVDRIALVEAANLDTMLYRFTSRDVHLITSDLTGTSAAGLTGSILCRDAATTTLQYLGCNTTREPLNNSALRRILDQGMNRNRVTSAFLSGHAKATQFPVHPFSPLYPAELEQPYSSAAFSAAVENFGYTWEHPLTLLVNSENSFKVSVATYLASQFTAGGIPVEVRELPWEEYTAALIAGDFDLYYGEVRLTADWNLSPLFADSGSLNYSGWSSLRTQQLLTQYAAAEDRSSAMEALCQHLQAQASILPICFKSSSVLFQSDVVSGITPTMTEPFYNLACTIHLQEPQT